MIREQRSKEKWRIYHTFSNLTLHDILIVRKCLSGLQGKLRLGEGPSMVQERPKSADEDTYTNMSSKV